MDMQQRYRSANYAVAQTARRCAVCDEVTRVVAVLLPVGHEMLDEEGADSPWQPVAANALLFFVTQLPRDAAHCLQQFAPGFDRAGAHWANHCEFCKAVLDDQDLHCEPGEGFVPADEAQGARIRLIEISESIEVSAAGYSLQPLFLPLARHA